MITTLYLHVGSDTVVDCHEQRGDGGYCAVVALDDVRLFISSSADAARFRDALVTAHLLLQAEERLTAAAPPEPKDDEVLF